MDNKQGQGLDQKGDMQNRQQGGEGNRDMEKDNQKKPAQGQQGQQGQKQGGDQGDQEQNDRERKSA